jgi:hypothetical protein
VRGAVGQKFDAAERATDQQKKAPCSSRSSRTVRARALVFVLGMYERRADQNSWQTPWPPVRRYLRPWGHRVLVNIRTATAPIANIIGHDRTSAATAGADAPSQGALMEFDYGPYVACH